MSSRADRLKRNSHSTGLLAVLNSRLPNHGENLKKMSEKGLGAIRAHRGAIALSVRSVGIYHRARQDLCSLRAG